MCGKSLVEREAMNSQTDGKNELPVSITEDGFEATVIAGPVNKYLTLTGAMHCAVARAYFAKSYGELKPEDRAAYIASNPLIDLATVAVLITRDLDSFAGFFAYILVDNADESASDFLVDVHKRIESELNESELAALGTMTYARYLEVTNKPE